MKLIKIITEIDTVESDDNTQTFYEFASIVLFQDKFSSIIVTKLIKTFIKMIFSKSAAMI